MFVGTKNFHGNKNYSKEQKMFLKSNLSTYSPNCNGSKVLSSVAHYGIALGSNLVSQFCRGRCIVVFPSQSNNNRISSCLLFNGPGNTVTNRPLANEIVPIKAAKDEHRPERYSTILHISFKFRIYR